MGETVVRWKYFVSEYISDNRKAEVWIKKILIRGHDTFMFETSG